MTHRPRFHPPNVAVTSPFGLLIERAAIPDWQTIHKFGRNPAVGTSYTPVTPGGIYRTPQAAGATALRVKAGNVNDTSAGTGARAITLYGLDETGAAIEETVATAGAAASAPTTATFIRLYRATVTASGTYATASAGSHAGDIVVENAAGTEDWATILANGFPRGQTEIGAYSIPAGFDGFLNRLQVTTDSTKNTSILFFRRESILETAAPYSGMRLLYNLETRGGGTNLDVNASPIHIEGPADIGFLASVDQGTAQVSVDFDLLLAAHVL